MVYANLVPELFAGVLVTLHSATWRNLVSEIVLVCNILQVVNVALRLRVFRKPF